MSNYLTMSQWALGLPIMNLNQNRGWKNNVKVLILYLLAYYWATTEKLALIYTKRNKHKHIHREFCFQKDCSGLM